VEKVLFEERRSAIIGKHAPGALLDLKVVSAAANETENDKLIQK
jgi:hypothetical protein